MTSQKRYYELKKLGLCTKCGKNKIDSSISTTRCAECYNRYTEANNQKKLDRKTSNICIQCGEEEPVGNSNLCIVCRQHNAELKRTLTGKKELAKLSTKQLCRKCGQPVDSLNIVCQNCLTEAYFSKEDALQRCGAKCYLCGDSTINNLRFVSTEISLPMKKAGPDLYKEICFNTSLPKDYRIACFECYWHENIEYIKHMRTFFDMGLATEDYEIEHEYE